MCGSCSDMIDSSIPSWGVDERVVFPGMEPVHQPLQTDLQALEAGEARRKDQVDLREDPRTPYQRLLESADIPEAKTVELRAQHTKLDPFELKKNIEIKFKKFFTSLPT